MFRSEFYAGQMYAMASGSRSHNLITGNIGSQLWTCLRSTGFEIYISDMLTHPASRT